MELLHGIRTRRSIRGFKPTPIPEETIREILAAAGRSPSYTNTQPWEIAVVRGDTLAEVSRRIYALADADQAGAPDLGTPQTWPANLAARAKHHGARRFRALGIEREDQAKRKEMRLMNFKFFGAPCALFLFEDQSLSPWSTLDAGMFVQSVCLAAHGLGLGTCLQASVADYPQAVRECLGLPDSKKFLVGISLGYPDEEARLNTYHSDRVDIEEFARWWN